MFIISKNTFLFLAAYASFSSSGRAESEGPQWKESLDWCAVAGCCFSQLYLRCPCVDLPPPPAGVDVAAEPLDRVGTVDVFWLRSYPQQPSQDKLTKEETLK